MIENGRDNFQADQHSYSGAKEFTGCKDFDKGFEIGYFRYPNFTGWGGGVPGLERGQGRWRAIAVSGSRQQEDIELVNTGALISR
jgi:uncharacterized protein (UPF0303 family)